VTVKYESLVIAAALFSVTEKILMFVSCKLMYSIYQLI